MREVLSLMIKELNIKWPTKRAILSSKDKDNLSFAEYKRKFL